MEHGLQAVPLEDVRCVLLEDARLALEVVELLQHPHYKALPNPTWHEFVPQIRVLVVEAEGLSALSVYGLHDQLGGFDLLFSSGKTIAECPLLIGA